MPERNQFQLAALYSYDVKRDMTLPANRLRGFPGVEVAYSDELDAVCPGGKGLSECATSCEVLKNTRAAAEQSQHGSTEGDIWTSYAWAMGKQCLECTKYCEGAALIRDGEPTWLQRLAFIERDDTIPTLHLDISGITRAADVSTFDLKGLIEPK
jgi:hypothetical protein